MGKGTGASLETCHMLKIFKYSLTLKNEGLATLFIKSTWLQSQFFMEQ